MPAVEYSKSFITSVVVGKDVVPRIGLNQMETFRADLINAIKRSVDPKWKTIACTLICCCCGPEPTSVVDMESHDSKVVVYEEVSDPSNDSKVPKVVFMYFCVVSSKELLHEKPVRIQTMVP